jgi:hypothetical protein
MADDDYEATMPKVAAGRAAVITQLRALATRLEELPLEVAADVLVLVEPALRSFERQAPSRSNAHRLALGKRRQRLIRFRVAVHRVVLGARQNRVGTIRSVSSRDTLESNANTGVLYATPHPFGATRQCR